jgi:D-alanyl-D-alanine dipeptidase
VYAGFGLACVLSGTSLIGHGTDRAGAAPGWAVVAVGTSTALSCGAVARYGLRPALRWLLWTLCALAGLAAFSLLMDVITLMFGQAVDSWPAAVNHALAAAGTLLLAATARSDHRPPDDTPTRPPSAAPRPVQLAAVAGTVAFLPYAAMKLTWASGGTFAGTSGAQMRAISRRNGASDMWLTLESWGLDATSLLAALGVFLLWGLVRPWGQVFPRWTLVLHGRRVPRWLPLTPALIGAATLAPYGVIGIGYAALATAGVVPMRQGDFPSATDALLVAWIGLSAFAVHGLALTVAARSYWTRTRRLADPATGPEHQAAREARQESQKKIGGPCRYGPVPFVVMVCGTPPHEKTTDPEGVRP